MVLRRCTSGGGGGVATVIAVSMAALLLTTNCNGFTSPDLLQQTSSRHTLSTIRHPRITTARYGFKEYPKEFDHTNDGSSDNQQGKNNGPSPEFYKKMGLSEPPPQQAPRMQQQQQTAVPPPQQFYDANGNPVTTTPMVYDANGNLVPFTPPPPPPVQQQMQQPPAVQTQQQQSSPASVVKAPQFVPNTPSSIEPPLPARSKSSDSPRPVGYNADAYAISNTADVYFAQLKQDSKVRKIARLQGDHETSEKVFGDTSVREIGDSWNSNPYTKEKNLEEARRQIEGTVRLQTETKEDIYAEAHKTSQLRYKDKLQQMKAKKLSGAKNVGGLGDGGGSSSGVTAAVENVQQPPPVVKKVLKIEEETSMVVSTQPPPATKSESHLPVVKPPPSKKVDMPKAPVASSSPPAVATSGVVEEDEHRGKLRTLQGLLLKQRGGPGFGAGRLKAPEAKRLEDIVEEVMEVLRSEVGGGTSVVTPEKVLETAHKAVSDPQPTEPEATLPPPPTMPVAATAQQQTADPLAGSVACVEAALKMYKESAPEDREAMMIPLREAMMAAANASNRAIAEKNGEVNNAPKAETSPVEQRTKPDDVPMMGFPASYEVTKPNKEEVAAVSKEALEELALAASKMDATKVSSLLEAGLEMDEEITNAAFWAVVNAVDQAEALDQPLSPDVPRMLHHIFDADHRHLLTREQIRTNVTCMMPETEGANRIGMNYIFDDSAHKDLPLEEGRRCAGGECCDKCSRNIFPTFALDGETDFDTFPELKSLTFNDLETVSAGTIIQFTRLVERVRRTIAYEYGLPLKTILPLQAYSRKYVAGTTQQGGGGGEGDFVTLHTDEATHDGYHYSCVLYLSTSGVDFEGGDFVFNDPDPEAKSKSDDEDNEMILSREELAQQIRRYGRKFTPFSPTRGAAVIFSSGWENMHEVEKITSGTRYCVPAFFTTCPVPEAAYTQMVQGKPKTDEDIADDWLHLLLAHQQEDAHISLGRVKELLMKWHYMCTPLSEH